ncbi:hypothetical protein AVEN_64818-1 [Araneus ventricosus]|uniref:Uncharacterized protein n=1 Tax=Araneus ventricosus TaxID=182803 RepID=A0A4Y2GKK6_ARAVE|nr:hypothetical protein AVEN_64818-1 [Araneus ventricosus]
MMKPDTLRGLLEPSNPQYNDIYALYEEIETLHKNYSGLQKHLEDTNASAEGRTRAKLHSLKMRNGLFKKNSKLYNEIYNQEYRYHISHSRGNESLNKEALNAETSQKPIDVINTTTEQRLDQQLESFERLVKNEKEYMFLMSRRYINMLRGALAFS